MSRHSISPHSPILLTCPTVHGAHLDSKLSLGPQPIVEIVPGNLPSAEEDVVRALADQIRRRLGMHVGADFHVGLRVAGLTTIGHSTSPLELYAVTKTLGPRAATKSRP